MLPRVFIGYDKRAPLAYTVLQHSIISHASGPVAVTPLIFDHAKKYGIKRAGLTEFSFTRYAVPLMCDHQGAALFIDSDMIVLGDIYELFELAASNKSVYVVKNKERFEWPSVMLFNCDRCHMLDAELINDGKPHEFNWATDGVGDIPETWNHLVGYDPPMKNPKLIHYTMGIPGFPECREHEHARVWFEERDRALGLPSWIELMGKSVHLNKVLGKLNIGLQ